MGVGGGGGIPSDYLVSTQLQLWLFCCWGCGCCCAVTIFGKKCWGHNMLITGQKLSLSFWFNGLLKLETIEYCPDQPNLYLSILSELGNNHLDPKLDAQSGLSLANICTAGLFGTYKALKFQKS